MKIRDGTAALMAAAIMGNVFQFNNIAGGKYRAVPSYRTADVTKIAEADADLKARYGLFFELGRRYPGSTIVLFRSKGLGAEFEASILSYGRGAHVALAMEEVLSDLQYERFIGAGGQGGRTGDPFIIAAGSNPKVFLALRRQGKTILLDLSLLLKARSRSRD